MSAKKHIQIEEDPKDKQHYHDTHHQVKPILHDGVYSSAGKVGKSQGAYLKVMNQHKPAQQLREISLKQLAEHHSQNSAWLSFRGFVYDATTYLKYHPGGRKLLEGSGKQCDQLIQKYHHWVNVEYLLQNFKIGTLKK